MTSSSPVRNDQQLTVIEPTSQQLTLISESFENFVTVDKDVYVGDRESSLDINVLKRHHITHVLTVAPEDECEQPFDHIKYDRVAVRDDGEHSMLPYVDKMVAMVNDARKHGGSVLVHCAEGKSRSPTLAIAYLMREKNATLKDALKLFKDQRPIVEPRYQLMQELIDYEYDLHGTHTASHEDNYVPIML